MAMARPRRPQAEIAAVREAADHIRAQTGLTSAKSVGREVAKRVVDLILDDQRNDPASVLSSIAARDPVAMLAFSEGFAACDELAPLYWDRVQSNFGISTAPEFQQELLRRAAASDLLEVIAGRYARQINCLGN